MVWVWIILCKQYIQRHSWTLDPSNQPIYSSNQPYIFFSSVFWKRLSDPLIHATQHIQCFNLESPHLPVRQGGSKLPPWPTLPASPTFLPFLCYIQTPHSVTSIPTLQVWTRIQVLDTSLVPFVYLNSFHLSYFQSLDLLAPYPSHTPICPVHGRTNKRRPHV